jgi:UrcA family protein
MDATASLHEFAPYDWPPGCIASRIAISVPRVTSAAGAAEIEKRVNDAAKEACKEISAKRPLQQFTTSEAECAKAAADKAMVKVHELEAAAAKMK